MALRESDLHYAEYNPTQPYCLGDYFNGEGKFLEAYVINNGTGSNNPKISLREIAKVVDENPLFDGIELETKKELIASIVWMGCENRALGERLAARILNLPRDKARYAIYGLQDDQMEYMLRIIQGEKQINDGFILVAGKINNSPRITPSPRSTPRKPVPLRISTYF